MLSRTLHITNQAILITLLTLTVLKTSGHMRLIVVQILLEVRVILLHTVLKELSYIHTIIEISSAAHEICYAPYKKHYACAKTQNIGSQASDSGFRPLTLPSKRM